MEALWRTDTFIPPNICVLICEDTDSVCACIKQQPQLVSNQRKQFEHKGTYCSIYRRPLLPCILIYVYFCRFFFYKRARMCQQMNIFLLVMMTAMINLVTLWSSNYSNPLLMVSNRCSTFLFFKLDVSRIHKVSFSICSFVIKRT